MAEPMTALVATFDDPGDAAKWLKHAHDENYKVAEGIAVTRDAQTGKIHKHLANLPGIASGAGVGAVVGAIIGVAFPPAILSEALLAAIGGAVIGGGAVAVKDEVVDRNAFKDVADDLEPGQSALVIVMPTESAKAFESELTGYNRKWLEEVKR